MTVWLGTVSTPSSEEYLRGERIAPILFKGLREPMQTFSDGWLVAVVYDLPLLAEQLDATGGGKGDQCYRNMCRTSITRLR